MARDLFSDDDIHKITESESVKKHIGENNIPESDGGQFPRWRIFPA